MAERTKSKYINTSEKVCKSCKYGITFGQGYCYCDYLHKKGKSRGCEVGVCDKYEKRGGKRK